MEKQNSQFEHGQPMELTRGLFCMCDSGAGDHNTSIISSNEFYVQSVLHGKWPWQLSIKFV